MNSFRRLPRSQRLKALNCPPDRGTPTGLWRRADGSVVATKRTMIAVETELPQIAGQAGETSAGDSE